jgi:diguanylate cyclase (GGDEF)-like protein
VRTVLWGYLALGAAGISAYPFVSAQAQDSIYLLSSASVVVAILYGLQVNRPVERRPWLWLAAGFACYLAGDLSWVYITHLLGEVPFPSVADIAYLLFYPLVFIALGGFLKATGIRDRAAWLDAAIWTIGVTILLWEPLVKPSATESSVGALSRIVAMAYPLFDVVLLLMVLRMVAGRGSLRPAYLLLTAGLMVQVLVDFVYGVRVIEGLYVNGELTDVGWLIINLLVGAAALHPTMIWLTRSGSRPAKLASRRRLQWLLAPALVAPALLVHQMTSHSLLGELEDGLFTAVVTALLLILVVTRGGGLLAVATQQSDELRERKTALEVALDDRERTAGELRSRVDRDTLTGLVSRDCFVEALSAEVTRWQEGGPCPSIAFLDLDDFKTVNDTLGHEAGDLLLVEIANRLQDAFGSADLVARFGGDEFAVLLNGDAALAAEQILAALEPPVLLNGRDMHPEVSIGVTTADGPLCTPGDMLREADVAMYTAKRTGGGWARYQPGMSRVLLARLDLRNHLVQALRDGEIQPWFQRVVELDTGQILGFEALARWCRPGEPVLEPGQWFVIAEETGLITEIDRAILHAALAQLALWRRDSRHDELNLAVNISGRTLQQPGIDAEVLNALHRHRVPPGRLIVEVTEGVLVDDKKVGGRLQRLRAAGVRISLDDFGTGWSSLSYLRRFPVDALKLDRTFTEELGKSAEADAIPTAIVQLARGLSLEAVAEGVETVDQQRRLSALGFRVAQGYLFGRAESAADCARAIQAGPLDLGLPVAGTDPALRLVGSPSAELLTADTPAAARPPASGGPPAA